jgi:hypothetical protein
MPKNGVCAEIGVFRGDFSARVLRVTRPRILHLIDPWKYEDGGAYQSAWYGGEKGQDQANMDRVYEEVKQRFNREIAAGVVRIHRSPSARASTEFDDGYFDWVYIDGNHLYEYVKQDLERFYPKVRSGGFLTGDDYTPGGWWKGGVKKAVDEFLEQRACDVVSLADGQFILGKP